MNRRLSWGLALALSAGCGRAPDPPRPAVDAARRVDAGPRLDAGRPDAGPPVVDVPAVDAPDAGPPPSVFLSTGGVERLRPGAIIPLRVWRRGPTATDVTAQARFRVEPTTRGRVLPGGRFQAGRELGRAELVAQVGPEQVRGTVEVSGTLPPGMAATPMVRGGPGRSVILARFGGLPGRVLTFEVEWVDGTLVLQGRGRARAYPVTVNVTYGNFDPHRGPEETRTVTGALVFERWTAGRLDGHAELAVGGEPLRFTFSMHDPDPWTLLIPPTEAPVTP